MGNLDKEEMQNRITALQRQARIPLPACLHLEAHLTACAGLLFPPLPVVRDR